MTLPSGQPQTTGVEEDRFFRSLRRSVRQGGMMFLATQNRALLFYNVLKGNQL